jgi:hypothetical protein
LPIIFWFYFFASRLRLSVVTFLKALQVAWQLCCKKQGNVKRFPALVHPWLHPSYFYCPMCENFISLPESRQQKNC